MAAPSDDKLLSRRSARRSFLWWLAALGLTATASPAESKPGNKSQTKTETVFRLLTPECDVDMSVEYFARTSMESIRLRDSLTNRSFCLSKNGEEEQSCVQRFSGSMAIARYHLRSRLDSKAPVTLRERVRTIDHDATMPPRAPFERVLAAERNIISDIQAFGYDPDGPRPDAGPVPVWCLLRQDLYLNDQIKAFMVVHWKHTLDSISLVDVIPGERTELVTG
jgi:hypothetical protein